MSTNASPPSKHDPEGRLPTWRRVRLWVSSSLLGHLVFFEIICGLPAIIYGVVSNESEGTLTASFATVMVLELIAIVAIAAAAVWYVITVPLIRRTKR